MKKIVSFQVSADEYAVIKREAAFSRRSMGSYIRERVFKDE